MYSPALRPKQIDSLIEYLTPSDLLDLGSERWINRHEILQNLNQEAVCEAAASKQELVKEGLINAGKTLILVHEAVLVSAWKENVLPIILELVPTPKTTFVAYAILYHEALAVGLLELILFHQNGCESLQDSAIDLLEYVYDAVTNLLVLKYKTQDSNEEDAAKSEELETILRQRDDLEFNIGIRCLSILRYLSENLDKVPLDVTSRIYQDLDVPTLLMEILVEKPWLRDGKIYRQGTWIDHNSEAISQAEAQVWLALRQILLDPECATQYSITNSRRSQMQKVLPLLTPTIMDQISPLVELNHWLCQATVANNPTAPPRKLLLRSIATMKRDILLKGKDKWKKIAKEQIGDVLCTDTQKIFRVAQRLSSAFNLGLIEKFDLQNTQVCKVCGMGALQRCSRCKAEWYCSKYCQTSDWNDHKKNCSSP